MSGREPGTARKRYTYEFNHEAALSVSVRAASEEEARERLGDLIGDGSSRKFAAAIRLRAGESLSVIDNIGERDLSATDGPRAGDEEEQA